MMRGIVVVAVVTVVSAIVCPTGQYEDNTGNCLECANKAGTFYVPAVDTNYQCSDYDPTHFSMNQNEWCEADVVPMDHCPMFCREECAPKYDWDDFGPGMCPPDMHVIHSAGKNNFLGSNYGECTDMCLPDFKSWARFLSMVVSFPQDDNKSGKGPCQGLYKYIIRSSPVWMISWTGEIGYHNFTTANPYQKKALNKNVYSRSPDVRPGNNDYNDEDGFDFSRCGGDGAFSKTFGEDADDTNIFIGIIKKGVTNVMINLTSENGDLDIQLFDPAIPSYTDSIGQVKYYKDEGKAVIAWCQTQGCNIAPVAIMQQKPVHDYFYDPTGLMINECTQFDADLPTELWKCTGCQMKSDKTSVNCKEMSPEGMYFNYSGYGDVGDPEYIFFPEVTRNLIMKAYAYIPGKADVTYSYGGEDSKCCRGEELCEGSFNRRLKLEAVVEIGRIPIGVRDLNIELRTEVEMAEEDAVMQSRDVDIRLYDEGWKNEPAPPEWVPGATQQDDNYDHSAGYPEGLALIAWCTYSCNHGFLQGPDADNFTWKGANYYWSGYNGIRDEAGLLDWGHEEIAVDYVSTPLMMKAYAYQEGTANIYYTYQFVPEFATND